MVSLQVHSTGKLLVPTVFAIEKITNGNQMIRIMAVRSTPPKPYFKIGLFLTPFGDG